ncbi:hypothetical protein F8M41_017411 [Gigaspora margarita]|uniref:Uncharacterized protein n=1 Tax=Gigaspora margarita TaxID=4874 RepID=A0A8H4EW54_GIGMA|nr:hypothetical protein F8M41_017411 [Gigaspora margarita]
MVSSGFVISPGITKGHPINCTLFYLYNDGGAKFNPVSESRFYNVTNLSGENLTIFIDLTKADATVGTQDIKIVDELTSSDASTTPTKASSADSISAPHVGFAVYFICLFKNFVITIK